MSVRHGDLAIRDVRLVESVDGEPGAGEAAAVLFREGRVAAIAPSDEPLPAAFGDVDETVDGAGLWLLPGWVDIQINDIAWLATGLHPVQEHRDRIDDVLRHQVRRGVTGFILATLAAPEEEIISYLGGMRRVLDDADANPRSSASAFLGGLVEGTFMNPAFHGAHNPDHVVAPEIPLLDRFLDTRAVRLVNVAPEMSPGALEVIAHAVQRGVVVGIGHAKPHAERVREAVAAGLRYVIHLGNGPTGSSLKGFSDGGLLEEALSSDALVITLIVDGCHLNDRVVRDWIARKNADGVIALSDAGFAQGNPEGAFEVFGIRGTVSPDGRYLQVVPAADAPEPNPFSSDSAPLFGSAADMRGIFERTLNLLTRHMTGVACRRHEALDLPHGLREATRLCSLNPSRLLDERDRGSLLPGHRADAILARIDGDAGAHEVHVEGVWLAGHEITSARAPDSGRSRDRA